MSKWVSIQSVLAQEEDRQKEQTVDKKNAQPSTITLPEISSEPINDQCDHSDSLISKRSKIKENVITKQARSDNSLTLNTSLVPKDNYAYRDTSLMPDTRLVSTTNQEIRKDAPTEPSLWASIPSVKGHTKFYNQIIDHLYPLLDPYEQAVYTQLFRLSWGYGKDNCNIGLPRLSERANISVTATQQALKRLGLKKLVTKTGWTIGRGKDQGTEYKLPLPTSLVQETSLVVTTSLIPNTSLTSNTTNKDHHDDLKKHDHHPNSLNNQTEHEKSVMMIYQRITENNWTKADRTNYEKIKHVPIEKIEIALRAAIERANNRPNSFAYFVKEIMSAANPPKQNRNQRKKALEKIIEQVKNSKVGSSYSISDLAYYVKEACVKNRVSYDTDLFDEIVSKK